MATSGNNSKVAASSTPAATPADSQSAAESDALPSRGAVRGDMLGIKDALSSELGQLSDGQNGKNGDGDPETEDTARLDAFDEDQAAQAAAELGDGDEGAADTGEDEPAAGGEQTDAPGDGAPENDSPETPADPAKATPAEAEKPKHEGLQARIDELTSRAKTAEEQLAAANEQLASFRAKEQGQLTPDVLDHVETLEELGQAQQRYSAFLRWATLNPEGGRLGDRDYSAEEVRNLQAEAQTLLFDAVPSRREYLASRAAADREAVNAYPWLKDAAKGAGAEVHKLIKELPAMRRSPRHRMIAADAHVGALLRSAGVQVTEQLVQRLAAEAKAPAKGSKPAAAAPAAATPRQVPARPPAAPGRAGVLPPRLTPRAAAAKVAGHRLRNSQGAEDDLADSIASKL